MRNFSKHIFTAAALAFVFSFFSVTDAQAQGPLNEILKRMEAHANALSSVQANIMMSKHDSLLDDYDVTKGSVSYLPGKGRRDILLRIDWTDPYEELLVVAKGEYVLYRPKLKQAIVGKTSNSNKNTKSSNSLAFMSMSKEQLKANYRVVYLGVEKVGGKEMWRLRLNPKTKAGYKYAELWVDGNGMPVQSKIIEKNDDSTTIRLSNIQKNVRIDAKKFGVRLKKDVKVIEG